MDPSNPALDPSNPAFDQHAFLAAFLAHVETLSQQRDALAAENARLLGAVKRGELANAKLRKGFRSVGERLSKHLPVGLRYDFRQEPWAVHQAAVAANIHLEEYQKELAELYAIGRQIINASAEDLPAAVQALRVNWQ